MNKRYCSLWIHQLPKHASQQQRHITSSLHNANHQIFLHICLQWELWLAFLDSSQLPAQGTTTYKQVDDPNKIKKNYLQQTDRTTPQKCGCTWPGFVIHDRHPNQVADLPLHLPQTEWVVWWHGDRLDIYMALALSYVATLLVCTPLPSQSITNMSTESTSFNDLK